MQEIIKKNMKTWSRLGQRGTVCGVALPEVAENHENLFVLTADLAQLSSLERFKNHYPDRFLNVGIAEQNMIGIAAGLAMGGNNVFTTTYATFLSMRCYEQIRHNLGYQGANVKLVASSAGMAMGMSGNTHYTIEDIAIMRAIPNMLVLSPSDAAEAYQMIHALADYEGSAYIRLTGNLNQPIVTAENDEFVIGQGKVMKEGSDVAIIATGGSVYDALEASNRLAENGINAKVVNMNCIKPFDQKLLRKCLDTELIVTVEEHSVIGGLGGAVAEALSKMKSHPRLKLIGIEDCFLRPASYEYLKQQTGLDSESIAASIKSEFFGE